LDQQGHKDHKDQQEDHKDHKAREDHKEPLAQLLLLVPPDLVPQVLPVLLDHKDHKDHLAE
jgi:hypothetical protein